MFLSQPPVHWLTNLELSLYGSIKVLMFRNADKLIDFPGSPRHLTPSHICFVCFKLGLYLLMFSSEIIRDMKDIRFSFAEVKAQPLAGTVVH